MTTLQISSAPTLPPAPTDSPDWPWQAPVHAEIPQLDHWPRITVITPSYNQTNFLEKTIRSVLLQNYPNLEYLIFDGASTDASPDIIEKYRPFLTHAESVKDRGQSHAINKGLARATGDIVCWLNSDDYFAPTTLHTVGHLFATRPEVNAIVGHVQTLLENGQTRLLEGNYQSYNRLVAFWKTYHMPQPAIFWRKKIQDRAGPLDESRHLIMDYDLWLRIGKHCDFTPIDQVLAYAHAHDQAKTGHDFSSYQRAQLARIFPRYCLPISPISFSLYLHLAKTVARYLLGKPTIYQKKYWINE